MPAMSERLPRRRTCSKTIVCPSGIHFGLISSTPPKAVSARRPSPTR
jgi:hypothetical protein